MKFLQKLGKSVMLPIACLPICGILMGIGYLLCPAGMQGGDIIGFAARMGFFLIKAGGALIDNIALLFAVGIGIGMSDDNDGVAGLAALCSWLIITCLLSKENMTTLMPSIAEEPLKLLAFDKIRNPFIGIMAGLIGAFCYNRFKNTKAPDFLAFFTGKRCVAIFAGLFSIIVAAILCFLWPLLFSGLVAFGQWICGLGAIGAGIYAFFNRLLIPFGLHHALNNVFWFDTIGIGDLTNYWAGKTAADVGWSLGMYMSGFFPCMMFGTAGAALAIFQSAKKGRKKVVGGLLFSAVVCAFLCGVTEPFEFMFMFAAPVLYVLYALLYGLFTVITTLLGFRAGFSFSAGLIDLVFSASLPAAQKTLLIIPLGIGAFVLFYLVFRFAIIKFDLKIIGGEEASEESFSEDHGDDDFYTMAVAIIHALGGKENIETLDHCITRLRLTLKDLSLVDMKGLKGTGIINALTMGEKGLQIIIGPKVQFVYDAMKMEMQNAMLPSRIETDDHKKDELNDGNDDQRVDTGAISDAQVQQEIILKAPISGKVIPLADIPDPTFSQGYLGQGLGILPEEETLVSPANGVIAVVAETKHALYITGEGGLEIMVHCGLDTVKMDGEGFDVRVNMGEKVRQGDPLLTFSKAKIKDAGYNDMVILTVMNSDTFENIRIIDQDHVSTKDPIIKM